MTVGVDPFDVAAAIFGSATSHSCDFYTQGGTQDCQIGTKNMCFLIEVYATDGDDMDGFGCNVVGTPGGHWYIRNIGHDVDRVYCRAMCI